MTSLELLSELMVRCTVDASLVVAAATSMVGEVRNEWRDESMSDLSDCAGDAGCELVSLLHCVDSTAFTSSVGTPLRRFTWNKPIKKKFNVCLLTD